MSLDQEFVSQVGEAYNHIYDIVYLRTHPLTEMLLRDTSLGRKEKAWKLHHLLLDTIEDLDPGPQVPALSREWRRHRLMALRYRDGLNPESVADRLAISRRTYYREHKDAIEAISELLRDKAVPASRSQQEVSQPDVQAHLTRMELLRLEAARLNQSKRYADLAQVIASAVQIVLRLAEERNVRIHTHLEAAVRDLTVDRNTVRQIVLQALSYLIGTSASDEIRVRAQETPEGAVISLLRKGEETRDRAGEQPQGQIRLSMLNELAMMYGACVDPIIKNEAIAGFQLRLPIIPPRTVLLVDDNEDTLHLMRQMLSQHGYRVITARTGAQAVALARTSQPYAISLDLMIPDQDGWDVLQTLANHPETQHIPVIVCTVLKANELALSLGATSFLEKPVTEKALISTLSLLEGT